MSPPPGPVRRKCTRPRVYIDGSSASRRAASCKRRTKTSSRRSRPDEFSARKRLMTATGVGHFGFQPSSRRAFSDDISMHTSLMRSHAGSTASDRPSLVAPGAELRADVDERARYADEAQIAGVGQLARRRGRLCGHVEGAARVFAQHQRHHLGDVLVPDERHGRPDVDDGAARQHGAVRVHRRRADDDRRTQPRDGDVGMLRLEFVEPRFDLELRRRIGERRLMHARRGLDDGPRMAVNDAVGGNRRGVDDLLDPGAHRRGDHVLRSADVDRVEHRGAAARR